jgi:hypothetical protein
MEAILHRIKAWLFPNALTTEDPNDFTARVSSEKSLNVQQVCETEVALLRPTMEKDSICLQTE